MRFLAHRAVQPILFHMAHDTNDASSDVPSRTPIWNRYGLAQRVPIGKIRTRQKIVDENDQLGIDVIRGGKKATAKQRYFHRAEVIGPSGIINGARNLRHGRRLARADPEGAGVVPMA